MNYSKGIYADKAWLSEQYVIQKKSLRQIAVSCGVDFKTIHYWVRHHELPRQPVGDRPGSASGKWKGGKTKIHGYAARKINGHYIAEHRIVAATVMKRGLRKGEVVHHIDINPLNNNPDNLYIFPSQAEHKSYHMALKYRHALPLKSNLKCSNKQNS